MDTSSVNQIVGIWSADSIYGPGAQSDTVLVFLPDGTGVMEEWNFSLCYYELLTWNVVGDLLNINGIKSVTQDDTGQTVDEPSLFGMVALQFTIAEESVPKGGVAEVLTLIHEGPNRLPFAEKYGRFAEGRFSQDGSDYELPIF